VAPRDAPLVRKAEWGVWFFFGGGTVPAKSFSPATRILARHLPQHIGERVLLQGWLHHQRHLKAVDFLLLRDRSGITQVVVESPDVREQLASCPHETVLAVTGTVVASSQAPNGVEIHDPEVVVLSENDDEPSIEL
jgi:nondiscriminating aspartyl-tRNA synthetase